MKQQTTVSPQLSVRRGREALEFYKVAFAAVEVYRVGGTLGHEEVVAQLSVGNASFWVSDESPSNGNYSPESLAGSTVRLLLVVQDPHSVVGRAVALGAREVRPVEEEYGWLLGRIEDPFGHHWEIGKPLVEWPPRPATGARPGRKLNLRIGDRVRVAETSLWAQGAAGTVGERLELGYDPEVPARIVDSMAAYWVDFDEPQMDGDGDGPYDGGEIDESDLSPMQ